MIKTAILAVKVSFVRAAGVLAKGRMRAAGRMFDMSALHHLFVLVYTEIYVFRGNPFHAHSLQQICHPTQPFKQGKYHTKSKT
jgi:hypothetical protein